MRRVISASRRTELLAHYPDYLARRLHQLGPHTIHTVVIWTKDPTNLLRHAGVRQALSGVGQVFLHWTVTGLGGAFLEPNVPPPQGQLPLLGDIAAYLGDPTRIHWRYDPLISARVVGRGYPGPPHLTNADLGLFRCLAEPFARAGVSTVHTSFVTLYRKVIRRLAAAGVSVDEFSAEARRGFLREMAAVARELGMELVTCCEPAGGTGSEPVSGPRPGRCIDGKLLAALHPTREPCAATPARDQRELCGCTVSLDIGRYLPCPNRCLYCYAHPAAAAITQEAAQR